MKKNCLIYNFAQHYRFGIFSLIDKTNDYDFYFGNSFNDVEKIDYGLLKNFKRELKNIKIISPLYFQSGAIKLFFSGYQNYLMLGEYHCLTTWAILLLSRLSKKKIFLWTHGMYGSEGVGKKIMKRIFYSLSDGIFLYGEHAKKIMLKQGYDDKKLHVIYNSLDYQKQLEVRRTLRPNPLFTNYFHNEQPTIIFIGRLLRSKKLDQLIDAIAVLNGRGYKLNTVLIGTGHDETFLKNRVQNLGLNHSFWFYGASYDEKSTGELLYNADICVSPGSIGLTAIHSLVYGTPVITHSHFSSQKPEFEVIEQGKTGSFFEKDNVDELAECIINWLLDNKGKRREVRMNCYRKIDQSYTPMKQLEILNSVIH